MARKLCIRVYSLTCKNLIAYAPSVGKTAADEAIPQYVIDGIRKFKRISARDDLTEQLVEQVTGNAPKRVLDPTFLAEFPRAELKAKRKPYILFYYCENLPENILNQIFSYAKEHGLAVYGAGECDKRYSEVTVTDMFMIYQINDAEKNREYRCRSYAYQIEHGFMITTDNYEISYCAKASQGLFPAKIRENMESLNPDKFKIRKFGVSDVIAITAAGKTAFYYVDKEALVKFNGFLAPKAEGSYLILNEGGYQIEGQTDTWKVIDEKNVQEQRFVQLVCEQTKKQKPDIVLHDSGVLVAQTIYGFDSSVMKKIEKFLREQKPELLHHQKFLENGTAERAKESGTEQNYNMIDGCVNNNPKKPRIIGNRISVLDRLHIKLEERKQKSQPQQQQQQERSRKN